MSGVGAKEAGTKLPCTGVLAPASYGRSDRTCCNVQTSPLPVRVGLVEGLKKGEASFMARCSRFRLVLMACRWCLLLAVQRAVLAPTVRRRRTSCLLKFHGKRQISGDFDRNDAISGPSDWLVNPPSTLSQALGYGIAERAEEQKNSTLQKRAEVALTLN